MGFLASLLIFAACTLGVLALDAALRPSTLQNRLVRLGAPQLNAAGRLEDFSAHLVDGAKAGIERAFAPWVARAKARGSDAFEHTRLRMVRAGYRSESAPLYHIATRTALVAGLPLAVWISPLPWMLSSPFDWLSPLLAAGLGYVAPGIWIDWCTRRRQEAVEVALPAALDLLVVCIEAGLGLMQSVGRVAQELRRNEPILSHELELVTLEARAGKGNADALRGLARRTNVGEVRVLVAMLTQTERFGTSLAGALRVHCDTARTRRMQNAEARAAQAPLKMLFPTALILMALVVLILGLAGLRASAVLNA